MMDRSDRAKQFLPFDAMKGLTEALRRQEQLLLRTEKKEKSEEDAEILSGKLAKAARGDFVRVRFFQNGFYSEKCGNIEEFNVIFKYMKIGGEKIFFEDIDDIAFGEDN